MLKTPTTKEVAGRYNWGGIYGVSSTMLLKEDSTFTFNWQAGLMWGETVGSWNIKRNKITLHSNQQPRNNTGIREPIMTKSTPSDHIEIEVIDQDSISLVLVGVALKRGNDKLWVGKADFNGKVVLPNIQADSIYITFPGFENITYPIKDTAISYYKFQMEMDDLGFRYFTQEKWKYRPNRLYDPTVYRDKNTKPHYHVKKF